MRQGVVGLFFSRQHLRQLLLLQISEFSKKCDIGLNYFLGGITKKEKCDMGLSFLLGNSPKKCDMGLNFVVAGFGT